MNPGNPRETEGAYRELNRRNWLILLAMAAVSYFFLDRSLTLGVILGGLMIIANFSALHHTVRKAFSFQGASKAGKASLILKAYFRLFFLGVILYVLITRGWVDPVGLTVGLSTVFLSIFSFGISRILKDRSRKAI